MNRLTPLLILPLVPLLALAGAQDKSASPPKKQTASAAAPAATYVGIEVCAGCHDEVVTNFKKNPHSVLSTNKSRGWEGKACEACHGPGSKHAETADPADIFNPLKAAPSKIEAMCLKCHKNSMTQVGRVQSSHARNEVPCTSCHNVHMTGEQSSRWIHSHTDAANKQCASCHSPVWASFQLPYHHRLPEGAGKCVDCHNPHSGFLASNNRLSNASDPSCMKCHSNYRGPFVYEHAPVKNSACSTCHQPHGSANPRMLTRANVGQVCLECHSNIQSPNPDGFIGSRPSANHNLANPQFRQCTVCHQKIHGSNVSRDFLR